MKKKSEKLKMKKEGFGVFSMANVFGTGCRYIKICLFVFCVLIAGNVLAQDFGFGFSDEETGSSAGVVNSLNVSLSGEVSASMTGFFDDFSDGLEQVQLGDLFSGKLNFFAGTSIAEGVINLNLDSSSISVDEAYLRLYLGSFDITAGLRKLTWGKVDVFGPLDVINPLNSSGIYTVMADQSDLMSVKIARPLVHASFRFGQFSKIEGVFVPNFEPHTIAQTGRWADSRMGILENPPIPLPPDSIAITEPDTGALNFAQTGLRFTTTIGSADIGVQYYYGRLPQPSVGITLNILSPPPQIQANILYNPYHQIGLDYAQVLFDFNVRAEVAANITEDLKGDDGSVYNPFAAWSFGFDRDIQGINLNFQVDQNIRLLHNKVKSNDFMSGIFDIEDGLPLTATRLTATVSRKFLSDELELRVAVVWGIEDEDCVIMPALIWARDDIRFAISSGFFVGNSGGQLGQYRDNNFIKISCAYTF